MKKIAALLLVIVLIFGFSSCSTTEENNENNVPVEEVTSPEESLLFSPYAKLMDESDYMMYILSPSVEKKHLQVLSYFEKGIDSGNYPKWACIARDTVENGRIFYLLNFDGTKSAQVYRYDDLTLLYYYADKTPEELYAEFITAQSSKNAEDNKSSLKGYYESYVNSGNELIDYYSSCYPNINEFKYEDYSLELTDGSMYDERFVFDNDNNLIGRSSSFDGEYWYYSLIKGNGEDQYKGMELLKQYCEKFNVFG